MTQKQILKKLIAHYSMVIRLCEIKDYKNTRRIIFDKGVHLGICYAASYYFDENIYGEKWVQKHNKHICFGSWDEYPNNFHKKEEIISSLQYRLDKMNEILNTLK